MRFRSYVWDPLLIISQILTLQACMYMTLQILVMVASALLHLHQQGEGLGKETISLDLLFGVQHLSSHDGSAQSSSSASSSSADEAAQALGVSLQNRAGVIIVPLVNGELSWWLAAALMLVNSFIGSIWLLLIVRRAKQCLDFAATFHLLHLVFSTVYGGFPWSVSWWLVNVASLAFMTVTGEFICMQNELSAIPILGARLGEL
ncbi:hypothetical protein CAOG_002934 [Capsaspora owczarzaki ATCC 30864]|uniref:Protein SYS1 homolog n=1 Tax=Capsaspora owczarzaki (strain ATCC 30864) TaxID=595528 RepID=A0A0D2U9X7_CAPO3|nr:hypothetical protein CAOG_002934 [Capsaspora owczarzaki ATCC 30864]